MPKLLRICVATLVVAFTIGTFAVANNNNVQDEKAKPKHTVKQVMAKTMAPRGDKLNKKVLSGQASDKEKMELLDMFISLAENDAPHGDKESWQSFSNAAVMAAARVAVGREGAVAELKAATNCKKCHDAHKPPKN